MGIWITAVLSEIVIGHALAIIFSGEHMPAHPRPGQPVGALAAAAHETYDRFDDAPFMPDWVLEVCEPRAPWDRCPCPRHRRSRVAQK